MNRRFWLRLAAGFSLVVSVSSAKAQDTGLFLNILPPGQRGYMTTAEGVAFLNDGTLPPHIDDQREMYGDLVFAPPGLTDEDLLTYFKPAPIAASATAPIVIQPPMQGVISITRDAFGVPHVKAGSRRALFRGIGYAMAQDRLFAMDLARHAGRGRLSEMVGADPFALEQDEAFYQFAGYAEEDYEAQIDALIRDNRNGRRAMLDIEAFLEGVNNFVSLANTFSGRTPVEYVGLDKLPIQPFKPTDVLAVAVTLELLFGAGGGGEHRNAILLQKLEQSLGTGQGGALFDDLRAAEEPEAPVTTELSFPFLAQGPIDPAAVAMPDVGSIVSAPMVQFTGPLAVSPIRLSFPKRTGPHPSMSNFLAITGANAAGGHPIAVMGPQTGYFVPELLTEISMEGAHFKARGVAVTGAPYVVLGRGRNYAWSATAGGSDTTDVRAEKLCEPGGGAPTLASTHYLFEGACTAMFERTDTWCAGTTAYCDANPHNVTAVVQRTVHGIVFARATVGGQPVALVKQRASFFREGENAAAFLRINRSTDTVRKFERAISFAPGSFNWLYVNQDDVFFFHSGLFPLRAPGVDYEMPSWGTGEWEWQGFMETAAHPAELNPAKGWITSWNNKPARDWRASDGNYTFGSVHRVDSLDAELESALMGGSPLTVARMVEIMEDAGTTDLRGTQVLPLALTLIGSEPSLEPVLTILDAWVAAGAPRRDRDDNGLYDHGTAVAVMDEWFERIVHAVFDAQLGAFYSDIPLGFDNEPGPVGSAYQSGYYGLLDKTFRMALGAPVSDPFDVLRCADGTAAACRAALVQSLADAVDALETEFASGDPSVWQADPTDDQIEFMPFGLAEVDPIPWVNRPTFQQVVQVTSKRAP
jgi:acyl-homoserine lactone acylase PvdQ